jgi:hypothetical protein
MVRQTLVVFGAIALAALGCRGANRSEDPASNTPSAEPPAVASAAGTTEFGVKECDEYVRKYTSCVDSKAPEAIRAQMHRALERSKVSWRAAAATPEGRLGLANACSQALSSARAAMQMYGCEW